MQWTLDLTIASLPPANEVCEGYVFMFFLPVCQSFCSRGKSTWQVPPPGRSPPAGTPPPPAGTPPGHGACWDTGQQVAGTHPAGMHSHFFKKFYRVVCENLMYIFTDALFTPNLKFLDACLLSPEISKLCSKVT